MPAVVIEVGSTMPGTADPGWRAIGEKLSQETQVFFYDRASLGKSDPAFLPRTLADFAEDLRLVLQAAAVPPPYILVGGSFGGMIVTHYASLHPQEVGGVMLVDSPHPEVNLRTLALLPPETPSEPKSLADFRRQAWLEQYAPPETFEREGLDATASIAQAQEIWDLRDIPLVVLTAGIDEWEESFPAETARRYEDLWLDMQKKLAGLSTRTTHTIVEDSDHLIHERRPEVVMEAVRNLAVKVL